MNKKSFLLLISVTVIWSIFFVGIKISVTALPAFLVGVYVRVFTLFALLVYMAQKGMVRDLVKTKPVLPLLLLTGVLGFGLDITSFLGMKMTTVSNASLLLKLDVLFANLITVFIFRQRLTMMNWISTMVTFIGVMIVLKVDIIHFKFSGMGDLLLIASCLMVTVNAFVIKTIQTHKAVEIKSEVIAFYNNFVTLLFFLTLTLFTGQYRDIEKIFLDPGLLIPLTITGMGQTSIYISYYYCLRRITIWTVKLFLLLIPVNSSIIAFFVLREGIDLNQVAGMALVIAGAAITMVQQFKTQEVQAVRY